MLRQLHVGRDKSNIEIGGSTVCGRFASFLFAALSKFRLQLVCKVGSIFELRAGPLKRVSVLLFKTVPSGEEFGAQIWVQIWNLIFGAQIWAYLAMFLGC